MRLLLLAPAFLLSACLVGPDFRPPNPELDSAFKNAGFSSPPPEGSWWSLFGDPALSGFIADAETGNPNAQAALARYDQARAALGLASADAFPTITGDAYARTVGDSSNSNFSAGSYNDYRAALNLSWEVDMWGRVRRQIGAAAADLEASAYDYQAALLSLRSEVARAYLSLRFADSEITLLEETVALREQARQLMKSRFEAGRSSSLDYNRAVTEHESVLAELQQLRAQRGRFENALAALTNRSASSFRVRPNGRQPKIPKVPAAVPSELLRRRPDLAAAEQRLAAASERIGLVIASYLPSLRITGYGGFQSLSTSDLFDPASKLWRLGPELDLPLYQAGRRGGDRQVAEATYREALASYRETLLRAIQETEDSLNDARHLADASATRKRGASSAEVVADLTRKRYAGGITDYFELVDAERTLFSEQRAALDIDLARALAATRLIQALGGGWQR